MFTPFVIFGLLRAGTFFSCGATLTNRTGPVGPNQHTFPTAAMCRTEAAGAGRRIYYRWPRATMRRQGRRETPACEVYPNRRRAFWAPLTALRAVKGKPAQRPRGGVTRKGGPSGPGYAGYILRMCRRPLCPFLRCMKFLLIQRLTCPIRRFSGFTGGEMNFHIVCGEATHGGKLCGVRAIDGWGNRKEPGTVYRSRLQPVEKVCLLADIFL